MPANSLRPQSCSKYLYLAQFPQRTTEHLLRRPCIIHLEQCARMRVLKVNCGIILHKRHPVEGFSNLVSKQLWGKAGLTGLVGIQLGFKQSTIIFSEVNFSGVIGNGMGMDLIISGVWLVDLPVIYPQSIRGDDKLYPTHEGQSSEVASPRKLENLSVWGRRLVALYTDYLWVSGELNEREHEVDAVFDNVVLPCDGKLCRWPRNRHECGMCGTWLERALYDTRISNDAQPWTGSNLVYSSYQNLIRLPFKSLHQWTRF